MAKLDVLHAAANRNCSKEPPYEGHTLSPTRWNEVLADSSSRRPVTKVRCRSKKLFGGNNPSPSDYEAARDTYGHYLERWQAGPQLKRSSSPSTLNCS